MHRGKNQSNLRMNLQGQKILRRILAVCSREHDAKIWALTQSNLGEALTNQGELASDPRHFFAALAAFREALTVFTRERDPIAWSSTEDNLGYTLMLLAEHDSDSAGLRAHMTEAIAAYNQALTVYNRDRDPMKWQWAKYEIGLANADIGLGERGIEHLLEAVKNYREALTVLSKDSTPEEWRATQTSLNQVLDDLHKRGWTGQ